MFNIFNRTDPNDELTEIIKEFNDAHQHLGHLTNQKYDTHTLKFTPRNWSTCAECWYSGDDTRRTFHDFLLLVENPVKYDKNEWSIYASDELWGITRTWMPLKKFLPILDKIATEWLELYNSLPTHWDVDIYSDGKLLLESTVGSLYERFFSTKSTEDSHEYKDYIKACIDNVYYKAKCANHLYDLTEQTLVYYWDKTYYLKNKDLIDDKLNAENAKNIELIRKHKAEEEAKKAFNDELNRFIFVRRKEVEYTVDHG